VTEPEAPLVWRRLDGGLLRLRVGLAVATVGPLLLVLAVVTLALAGPAEAAGVLLVGLVGLGLVLVSVARRFAAWAYAERADDLLLRRGVLLQRTTVVPYGRMQFVDVTAGPLDRRFGLATVVLHTASTATDATIRGLQHAEAVRLRDRLAALGEARAAGV
jgi:membrane protein YdbS with pleckstrin-like domain